MNRLSPEEEAEDCRRKALSYLGRPEASFPLKVHVSLIGSPPSGLTEFLEKNAEVAARKNGFSGHVCFWSKADSRSIKRCQKGVGLLRAHSLIP